MTSTTLSFLALQSSPVLVSNHDLWRPVRPDESGCKHHSTQLELHLRHCPFTTFDIRVAASVDYSLNSSQP